MNVARIRNLFAASVLLAGTAAGTAAVSAAQATSGQGGGSAPDFVLSEDMQGRRALQALGERVPEAAARNGMTTSEFQARIHRDDEVWVGRTGILLFVDGDHAEAETSGAEPVVAEAPLSETFQLNSRPGASRVVYLDFDGVDAKGTAWDSGSTPTTAAPYDTDGSPSTFSDAERTVIQSVWNRVAEDYSPFDVNVTTQDPGIDAIRRSSSTDTLFGTRVVVTPTKTYNCSCGGVAYVGTYDSYGTRSDGTPTHDYYQPAWVFTSGVGSGAKNIAEAAAHEAGHNLGLSHDGTSTSSYYGGHGDWAPIMGVGYNRPITQWSKGEYSGANNTEDDFVVIGQNGVVLRGDDHGNTASTATALSGGTVSRSGVISTRTDVDVFTFTTNGGSVSLTASPAAVSPDLDIKLTLRDAAGAILATADPSSGASSGSDTTVGVDAAVSATVGSGTFTVTVDGVGFGDPLTTGYSDYASVGAYTLSGVIPDGAVTNRAPVAAASAPNSANLVAPATISLDGSGSTDPDGDAVTYSWSLGSTVVATSASPTVQMSEAGTYTFVLTVSDGQLSDTASVTVVVAPPAATLPAAPSSVSASASTGSIQVGWTDNSTNETGFVIRREYRHKSGSWRGLTTVATTTAGATSFTDTSVAAGTTYRYLVHAYNSAGSSSVVLSNTVTTPGTRAKNSRII